MHRGGWVLHTLTALTHCTLLTKVWGPKSIVKATQRCLSGSAIHWGSRFMVDPGCRCPVFRCGQGDGSRRSGFTKWLRWRSRRLPGLDDHLRLFFGARMEHQSLHVTALMPTLDWQTLSTLDLWPWLSIGKVTLKIATNWYNIIYINTCVRVLG